LRKIQDSLSISVTARACETSNASRSPIALIFSIRDSSVLPSEIVSKSEKSAHTKNTDANIKSVLATIEQTQKKGYILDNEEYVLGARCIAAPIKNAFGKTITASTSTFKKSMIPAMAKRTIAAATEISLNMGFEHN
jgi:DNA-binding IclR family transcriptional regulator